ncbi:hypothetical protein [Nocardia sp. bgisy134]|uniref:hypothetical protein n=1 Tax=Nocardia sp. bgisy134 TaxID=3413789 RepID=UPI003D710EF1
MREAITELHEYVARVERAPRISASDVDAAVADALETFKSDLNVSAGKDFKVAIWGGAITVVGMLVSLASQLT